MIPDPLYLGIDLGTGKVALALCDASGQGIFHDSRPHKADLPGPVDAAEQDAGLILETAFQLIAALPPELIQRLAAIGLTGQMHGVVRHDTTAEALSPLVTWRDARGTGLCIDGRPVSPGCGWNTLDRWAHSGELTAPRCATIHGLLAARLCQLDRAPIDPTDLHAWGGTNPPPSVPASILPTAVGHGAIIGQTKRTPNLPDGLPVAAPLGDNQASVRGTLMDLDAEAAFTIGTGCQLSVPVPQGHPLPEADDHWELRPFDKERDLLVAAPRNGGLVWQWLAERVRQWSSELGGPEHSMASAYDLLDHLGRSADESLRFAPHLIGESWDSELNGRLSGLRPENGSLGQIARAVAHSIAASARDILPAGSLEGRRGIRGSGNALRRSSLLRRESAAALGRPIELSEYEEEAALGAARVARNSTIP